MSLLLAEELVLLLIDDEKGTWLTPRHTLAPVVRVALVAELLARRTLELDDDGRLVPGVTSATGDDLLDRTRDRVSGHRVTDRRVSHHGEVRAVLSRLRERGTLRRGTVLRTRHLTRDTGPETRVRERLLSALTGAARPDTATALLAALVAELGLLPRLFPDQDASALTARAALITEELRASGDYHGSGVREAEEARAKAQRTGDLLDGAGDVLDLLHLIGASGRVLGFGGRALRGLFEGLDLLP